MEEELDLLLSVAGGLGRWQYVDDLQRVYVKDDDCLGEYLSAWAHACYGLPSATAAGVHVYRCMRSAMRSIAVCTATCIVALQQVE
jgi:hypothetical protein